MTRKKFIKDNPMKIAQRTIDCPTLVSDKTVPLKSRMKAIPLKRAQPNLMPLT